MKLMKLIPAFLLAAVTVTGADLNQPPKGFKALFNGKDLKGWWGLKTEDPAKWMALDKKALAKKKADSLKDIQQHWSVKDGILINDGHGLYLSTVKTTATLSCTWTTKPSPRPTAVFICAACRKCRFGTLPGRRQMEDRRGQRLRRSVE